MVPSLSKKFIQNSHQNFLFGQYLGTKQDRLFHIAKSGEKVIMFGKNSYFTLKWSISCENSTLLLPLSTLIFQEVNFSLKISINLALNIVIMIV